MLAGARCRRTGLVGFSELEVANVTVRSALWGREAVVMRPCGPRSRDCAERRSPHRFCNISISLTKRKGAMSGRRYTHCNRTARIAEPGAARYGERPRARGHPGRKQGQNQVREDRMSLRINTNIEAFNAHRQLVGTADEHVEVDGEALLGPAHQPRRRRRRRPRHLREDARPDPRHRAGPAATRWTASRMVQTAEGALNEVHSILQRVRELAVQYNNGTLSTARPRGHHGRDRAALRRGAAASSRTTPFNGINVLELDDADHLPGRRQRRRDDHDHARPRPRRPTYNYFASVFVSTFTAGGADIDAIGRCALLGRRHPGHARRGRRTASSTRSRTSRPTRRTSRPPRARIRDTDMATEMTTFTKLQILQQSGVCDARDRRTRRRTRFSR